MLLHVYTRTEPQGAEASKHKKVEIEWACRDGIKELNSWTHTTQSPGPGFYEDVPGGAELVFDVSVSAPAAVAAGIRCVALVVADKEVCMHNRAKDLPWLNQIGFGRPAQLSFCPIGGSTRRAPGNTRKWR